VLTDHNISHIKELKVHKRFFTHTFRAGCSMQNCDATCCSQGVLLDPTEKEKILSHAETIIKYMEPQHEKDPTRWFDNAAELDTDFPSGKAEGTQTRDYGCVFLKSNGHCVLQAAASAEGKHKFFLKPFFCVAFPVTLHHGELEIEDPGYTNRKECCSVDEAGELHVLDLLAEEFEYILGSKGFEDLKRLAQP